MKKSFLEETGTEHLGWSGLFAAIGKDAIAYLFKSSHKIAIFACLYMTMSMYMDNAVQQVKQAPQPVLAVHQTVPNNVEPLPQLQSTVEIKREELKTYRKALQLLDKTTIALGKTQEQYALVSDSLRKQIHDNEILEETISNSDEEIFQLHAKIEELTRENEYLARNEKLTQKDNRILTSNLNTMKSANDILLEANKKLLASNFQLEAELLSSDGMETFEQSSMAYAEELVAGLSDIESKIVH